MELTKQERIDLFNEWVNRPPEIIGAEFDRLTDLSWLITSGQAEGDAERMGEIAYWLAEIAGNNPLILNILSVARMSGNLTDRKLFAKALLEEHRYGLFDKEVIELLIKKQDAISDRTWLPDEWRNGNAYFGKMDDEL